MFYANLRRATGLIAVCLAAGASSTASRADGLPRVESGGRVVVIDDFEQGNLDAWSGSARVEIVPGDTPGNHVLLWHATDAYSGLAYKLVEQVPDWSKYTRVLMDIRAFSPEGLKGPGVAIGGDLVFGGLPCQVSDLTPSWGLYDFRPVFSDTWRAFTAWATYPAWYVFFEKRDNTKRSLELRANASFGTAATLMIDNLRLVADVVEVLGKEEGGVWGEGRWLANGDYRYDYRLRIRNLTDEPRTVRARADTSLLREFRGTLVQSTATLPPGGEKVLPACVDVPAARLDKLPDLHYEEMLVTVEAEGAEGTAQVVPLLATKPLGKLPHPCILHPPAWWEQERARFAALTPEEQAKELAPANELLPKETPFPSTPAPQSNLDTGQSGRPHNSGKPYFRPGWTEAEMAVFTGNFGAVRRLGMAYQLTRDERYAKKAVAILLDLADKYPHYPMRATIGWEAGNARIAPNNLHEGYWISDLAGSYDLILDSPSLTPEARATIRREVLLPAARCETTICSGFNNQTSTRYAAAALFGLLADDANLVQHGLYGHHGVALAADVSISPDGFLTEIPVSYHWASLSELMRLPLVCRNAGLRVKVATARIKTACDTPYQRAMPNLDAPPFGSCGYGVGAPFASGFGVGSYTGAADLFGDPLYVKLADPKQRREVIDALPSLAFESGGMVVLREKERTGPDRTYLAMLSTNTRRAGGENLHFVLYSDGEILCPSMGSLYNAHGNADWVSPWANTIVVDRKPQQSSLGRILAHDFAGPAQMALLDGGAIAAGVTLQRAVALAGGMVFLVDRADSAEEHTYERVQMARQEIARPPAEQTDLELAEGEHIRFRGTRIDGNWGMAWRVPKGPGLELRMAGEAGTEVFWGDNQVNAYKPQMYAPTVVARRKTKATVYLTVMEPFRDRPARLQGAERVKVMAGNREATASEAVAVAAVTGTEKIVFVVNFDGTPKICEGRAVTSRLAVLKAEPPSAGS